LAAGGNRRWQIHLSGFDTTGNSQGVIGMSGYAIAIRYRLRVFLLIEIFELDGVSEWCQRQYHQHDSGMFGHHDPLVRFDARLFRHDSG
jgi:hypothetical protein